MKNVVCILIMFTLSLYANSNESINTITLINDQIVTNMVETEKKNDSAYEIIKRTSLPINKEFSIKVTTPNLNEYIKITSFSENIDFIRFTRDKTNSLITFRTLANGSAKLNFQVDNKDAVVRKYFYTINITNVIEQNNQFSQSKNIPIKNAKPRKESISKTIPLAKARFLNTTTPNTEIVSEDKKLYEMALDLENSMNYDEALKIYSNISTVYTNSPYKIESMIKTANIYNRQNNSDNAIAKYKEISDDKTATADQKANSIYDMGTTLKKQNKDKEAMVEFLKVIYLYPETKSAYNSSFDYADSLNNTGDLSAGFEILSKSLSDDTDFEKRPEALILLAKMYEYGDPTIRDYQKSYETYSKYLEEFPNSRQAKEAYDRQLFLQRNFINIR